MYVVYMFVIVRKGHFVEKNGHNGHFLQHNWYIFRELLKSIIGGGKSIIDSSLARHCYCVEEDFKAN